MSITPSDKVQIQSTLDLLRRTFSDELLGVYLHGSAASCGLQAQSDIDLLAVVETDMTESKRKHLTMGLLHLSGRHPRVRDGARCLEVMVFRKADLAQGEYPARAEFVYGEWLRDTFEAGESPMPERDAEFSLVLAQARQEAIHLFGRPVNELLAHVPAAHVSRAMLDSIPDLLDRLHGDERNVLLTLARMLYTAYTGEFVAKDVAANWAIPRLSIPNARSLERARHEYLGEPANECKCEKDNVLEFTRLLRATIADSP